MQPVLGRSVAVDGLQEFLGIHFSTPDEVADLGGSPSSGLADRFNFANRLEARLLAPFAPQILQLADVVRDRLSISFLS